MKYFKIDVNILNYYIFIFRHYFLMNTKVFNFRVKHIK